MAGSSALSQVAYSAAIQGSPGSIDEPVVNQAPATWVEAYYLAAYYLGAAAKNASWTAYPLLKSKAAQEFTKATAYAPTEGNVASFVHSAEGEPTAISEYLLGVARYIASFQDPKLTPFSARLTILAQVPAIRQAQENRVDAYESVAAKAKALVETPAALATQVQGVVSQTGAALSKFALLGGFGLLALGGIAVVLTKKKKNPSNLEVWSDTTLKLVDVGMRAALFGVGLALATGSIAITAGTGGAGGLLAWVPGGLGGLLMLGAAASFGLFPVGTLTQISARNPAKRLKRSSVKGYLGRRRK